MCFRIFTLALPRTTLPSRRRNSGSQRKWALMADSRMRLRLLNPPRARHHTRSDVSVIDRNQPTVEFFGSGVI